MNEITDAILLKDTASRGKVAMTYAMIGLLTGVFFFSSKS